MKLAFTWTDECEVAFKKLKRYLSNLPLLRMSKEGKELFLYLVVFAIAVSATLIWEESRI